MFYVLAAPIAVQAVLLLVDEFFFHYRRGLPRWERIGHPLDTLTVLMAYTYVFLTPFEVGSVSGFIFLGIFSMLFVTKDEFVHTRECTGGENLLHAFLYLVHPLVLLSLGLIWWTRDVPTSYFSTDREILVLFIQGQAAITLLFMAYQAIYWNLIKRQ